MSWNRRNVFEYKIRDKQTLGDEQFLIDCWIMLEASPPHLLVITIEKELNTNGKQISGLPQPVARVQTFVTAIDLRWANVKNREELAALIKLLNTACGPETHDVVQMIFWDLIIMRAFYDQNHWLRFQLPSWWKNMENVVHQQELNKIQPIMES